MTNPDIECLPTDFVGISRPSKRLEALYQKKEREQVEAIKELEDKKLEICKRYEKLIEKRSEQISRNLEEMRTTLKDEMYNFKIEMFRDQASIDKYEFKKIYKKVLLQAEQHHSLIETFYKDLCEMEKNKSKELTIALKFTYNAIKSISLKLPKENDEWVELEIEKLNQTILCNNRNYLELKTQFQTAVQNDTKLKISDLQNIKENWIKISKERSQQAADDLKEKYVSEMTKMADKLKTETMDKMLNVLPSVASLPNRQNPEEWLENIRLTLATLDQKSQKIMMSYKQAAVVIYNRFFQELKVLKETLDEIGEGEQISKGQASMYTPDLDEIRLNYGDDLERIKVVWDEVVEQISKTVDNTHDFLVAATSLWEDHFCRTKVLQIIVLKDIENTVKKHNTLSELCETKVNILIDTLRQEPSKEKLKKTLEDLKKSLSSIEVLYKTQYQAEVNVLKKFNSMQELKADILVAEIKRFLEVYPPDMEKDPKIQCEKLQQIKNKFDEVYYSINKILEEYKFVGDLDEMQKKLKYDLSKQVCTFQYKLKSIITQYKKTKKEILANVGSFHYFKTFVEAIEDIIKKLRLLSDFLDLPEPVVFYSDKSSSTSTDRSIKPRQSSMGRGPQYIENYANKLESQIFNFNLDSQTSSYFNKLNQILKEYWNNVINCTKTFFVHLPRCIYLEDKVFSGPVALMKDLHSKMLDYQSQCETRIMQDTKEYLFFTITFIIFLQDYLDMYPEEYSRKFLKHFENVFENEIKRDLQKHKEDIRDKFEDLQKKLKTWYGHPQHRGILEKLQIEAEILTSEAKETCEDIKYPYLAKLEQEYNRAILEYNDLKENLVPVLDMTEHFQREILELTRKLNDKVTILRNLVGSEDQLTSDHMSKKSSKNDIVLSNCKSFLTIFDSSTLPQIGGSCVPTLAEFSTLTEMINHSWYEPSPSHETVNDKSLLSLTKSGENCTDEGNLASSYMETSYVETNDKIDNFFNILKQNYIKYCRQINMQNVEQTVVDMKNDWQMAVNRVLALYAVKYDVPSNGPRKSHKMSK
ncbi:uncharacterized protein LOC126740337 isoform X3 [Anthonomus grandis grandis]|uniref:uncharacterized protein LOC126740337 isoform X3 n=1 Tax=Anthonomus grandis grandis TaxID=2921223 RepID=UPI002165CFD4|nr:uncharacterized protein LOC126740337 isoform X3 [Anthonomus grandis grandis]